MSSDADAFDEAKVLAIQNAWRALPALDRARQVISDLFIDTEHDEMSLIAIAEALVETGFSIDKLEQMYSDDIAPVCFWLSPAGPWPAIDQAWLRTEIEKNKKRHALLSLNYQLRKTLGTRFARENWERVKAYVSNPQRLTAEASRLRSAA
jgi:hypothetical protein